MHGWHHCYERDIHKWPSTKQARLPTRAGKATRGLESPILGLVRRQRGFKKAAADFELCSVVEYEISTGCLLLEHTVQQHGLPTTQASIDVRLILESIKAYDLQRGTWLNIIGYVRKPKQWQKKMVSSNTNDGKAAAMPVVQAIIAWDAGAIKVADYEAALVSQRKMKEAVDFHAMT